MFIFVAGGSLAKIAAFIRLQLRRLVFSWRWSSILNESDPWSIQSPPIFVGEPLVPRRDLEIRQKRTTDRGSGFCSPPVDDETRIGAVVFFAGPRNSSVLALCDLWKEMHQSSSPSSTAVEVLEDFVGKDKRGDEERTKRRERQFDRENGGRLRG